MQHCIPFCSLSLILGVKALNCCSVFIQISSPEEVHFSHHLLGCLGLSLFIFGGEGKYIEAFNQHCVYSFHWLTDRNLATKRYK